MFLLIHNHWKIIEDNKAEQLLSEEQKQLCEERLTLYECETALKSMNNNKTAG